ncbi:MAG: BrnT family toxin [Candidatus Competibacteraceae bacterium]|nr:BrnT family toxin [Candidatus Competibacteraceae bacterium]MCB1812223.1 BrnT family toxin [Candidatus Competibacteraceae bacterium]
MEIEYDSNKAASNLAKHDISFAEAETVLFDSNALGFEDYDSEEEPRWVLLGMSSQGRLLIVVYTLRGEDRIRLISARKATRREAKQYA